MFLHDLQFAILSILESVNFLEYIVILVSRQPIVLVCAGISMRCLDYQICKTRNCWRSVDAHFQNLARSMSLLLLPIKAANISLMDVCNQSELTLPKMQSSKSSTLHWRSLQGWGSYHVAFSFEWWKPPIQQLCITVTKSPFNYHTYQTINCWHSVDAQIQNMAVTVSLCVSPIKAANM